ncbi:tRNA-dihydrouridine(47) synthase [NAD(P)(+)]-like isoform X2 [Papaver somniferum]|uniref:tRNA-dihydrouridine(47) synthase [NAD(P)(+)]-like isoform X2 n=1 Tax=Papaver somniferum TaxID=3469 RepID=UPI000E6F5DB8|nr:tRNA-dihydrouridine(47) synthase [NAD(P)(+)]-like isoform X2 [Papaver somniferum]
MDGASTIEEVEAVETPTVISNPVANVVLTPEELIAKSIAPVKKEFLRPPQHTRPCPNVKGEDGVSSETNESDGYHSKYSKNTKSKRQLKRERQEEKKTGICPKVAKTGCVSSCTYGTDCRFSHDVDAYKAQKPVDLEGNCPFLSLEGPCPYGLACRYSGTHKDENAMEIVGMGNERYETNELKKAVQKLLWKNVMTFPKADAQLKALGILDNYKLKKGKAKGEGGEVEKVEVEGEVEMVEADQGIVNGSSTAFENDSGENGASTNKTECTEEVKLEEGNVKISLSTDGPRPIKMAKHSNGEPCSDDMDNGSMKNDLEMRTEVEASQTDDISSEADACLKLHPREKKLIDFSGKLYLAPLTTVGNLPFRRVCKNLGADITCGEMAMCTNLLQGQASEWALLRRHSSEDLFGVQICGSFPDTIARTVELIDRECTVDFIDINMGCPIDLVVDKGAGSCLLTKPVRMKGIIKAASATVDTPITVKVRTAYFEGKNRIDSLISDIGSWGATALTIHGRSRQQRYSKLADWDYIYQCARKAPDSLQVLGNGDIFSYVDWNKHLSDCPKISACMIARGSLIKPWLFTEIKEQRHWDISSSERLGIYKDYVRCGLQHWGSDTKGVETTRYFLLEWLSYLYRYIPVGLLDVVPSKLNWRSPSFYGRDDLETLMASESAADWIRISEMLLGKVPAGFHFAPKHKSNAYDKAENG